MPVLGSASTAGSGSGSLTRGVVIPTGSLDTFKAALKAHATGRCEIVLFGDSTDDGANDYEGIGSTYPWAMRLLDKLRTAGVTYGGRGLFSARASIDSASPYTKDPDGFPIVSAKDASGWVEDTSVVNGWACPAAGVGKTITFQGTGTAVRVNTQRGYNSGSKIGVTIDGGTETVYDTNVPNPQPAYYDVQPQTTTGLTEGTHTVVLRNAGGADITGPNSAALSLVTGAGSGPTAGTYWYGITAVSANGESAMSTPISVVLNGSKTVQIKFWSQWGWTNVNLYRSTTQNGTYGLVGTMAAPTVPLGMAGTQSGLLDTTNAGTPGAAPPGSSTLGQLSGQSAAVGIEFIRDAGVIIHNEGIYGKSFADFFDHTASNAAGWRGYSPARLGLQSEVQAYASNRNLGFLNGLPKGAHPRYRDVKLLILKLGTNDINGGSAESTGQTVTAWNNYFENIAYAIRTARAAGADVLVISPPFTDAADPGSNHYSGRFKGALFGMAMAHGCAYVDFQEALGWDMVNHATNGYSGGTQGVGNPHLKIAGYQAEADWLYTNVFAPLLAS